jgi:hypothetical protein
LSARNGERAAHRSRHSTPAPDGGVDQDQVQVFAPESQTSKQAWIARFNRDTVPGHEHAVHLQRGALEFAVKAETFENATGARVQGVATKLGTREGRPIDQAHTHPCAGQHSRGDRAGWSCPDDEDVEHGHCLNRSACS